MPLSLTTITGTVYDVNGNVAAGVTVYVHRVLKDGTLIQPIKKLVATSDALGAVSFNLPRASSAWIEGKFYVGNTDFDVTGGVDTSIPDLASATLESLAPVTFPISQTTYNFLSLLDTPDTFVGQALKVARVNAGEAGLEFAALDAAVDARIKLLQKWALNFTGNGDIYLPAYEAMTVDIGTAAIGTGTLAYAKSTTAAPETFNSTTLPATLEVGAWLKITASAISGFKAVELKRTA